MSDIKYKCIFCDDNFVLDSSIEEIDCPKCRRHLSLKHLPEKTEINVQPAVETLPPNFSSPEPNWVKKIYYLLLWMLVIIPISIAVIWGVIFLSAH